jgi:fused signal recognition particle receptor
MAEESRGFFRSLVDRVRGEGDAVQEEVAKKEDSTTGELQEGFFERLKRGLSKTHDNLVGRIDRLVMGRKSIDSDLLEELEEVLITADIGVSTTVGLIRSLEEKLRRNELKDGEALKAALRQELLARLQHQARPLEVLGGKPFVILVIGVNGAGKTTTIGKMAARFASEGKRVLVAAADTFRAAAADQLQVWTDRAEVQLVRHAEGADPAAVVFDALKASTARDVDVLIIDTAGRLHTRVNLMEELKKIRRIITREIPEAPHETLLVLDATTGQNAANQTRIFKEATNVSGIVLTKLDGTAKGGILVAVTTEFDIPVRYVGVGEGIQDLRPFVPSEFVDALFS